MLENVTSLMRRTCVVGVLALAALSPSGVLAEESTLLQFTAGGRQHTGISLGRNATIWLILSTSGQLHYLETEAEFQLVQEIPGTYTADSFVKMRGELEREFGPTFEVVPTKHFLVVQPRGRGTKWPSTFEKLHLEFVSHMKLRGATIRNGKFPMVAVVFPDRVALQNELQRQGVSRQGVAGIYIANSNRVYTQDNGATGNIMAVLRHEAAHQSAFNSNIHGRLNDTPKWITEGLGMLFEVPAFADGRTSLSPSSRAHAEAVARMRSRYSDSRFSLASDITRLIADDTMFDADHEVHHAYAVSWLMMFALCEKTPRQFAEILNHTTSRPPFVDYRRDERRADFEHVTGQSIERFAADAMRLLSSL